MAAFSYKALDVTGKMHKGIMEGDVARSVRVQLRSRGLKPIDVQPTARKTEKNRQRRFIRRHIHNTDLALFTRQLATLIQAGVPLDDALAAVASQSNRLRLQEVVLQLRARVREGFPLASALADYPGVFNDMYCAMVRAGEQSGFLGPVLEHLAEYREERQHTQQKIKMALVYPLILMLVAMTVILLLMVFVVPELTGLFHHAGAELPLLTKALIVSSDFLSVYWLYCLLLLAGASGAIRWFFTRPNVQTHWHASQLKIPFIANFVTAVNSARFASTLSILVSSGVPLLEGLRIAGQVLTNRTMREACAEVVSSVQEGASLNRALLQAKRFPPILIHMVASGEQSGALETMLARCARNQERELEMKVGAFTTIFEPFMVLVMATVVGVIVVAILLPIVQMNNLVG